MWKRFVWNPATCNCENGKYLSSIMDDLKIMCDKIIKPYNHETKFIEKRATCKM